MTYHAQTHTAVVTVSDRNKHVYRSLTFRIPDFSLVASRVLPETWHEDGDTSDAGSGTKSENEFAGIHLPGLVTNGDQSGHLDPTLYHGDDVSACRDTSGRKLLLSEVVSQIRDVALLRLYCTGGPRLATVAIASRKITLLDLPAPPRDYLHLTGDGRYLLAQSPSGSRYVAGDQVWLVNLITGKTEKHWREKRFRGSAFFAFAPEGRLLFQDDVHTFAEPTGIDFLPTAPDNGFFADR